MVSRQAIRFVAMGVVPIAIFGGASAWISRAGGSWEIEVESLVPVELPVMVERPAVPVIASQWRGVPGNILKTASMTPHSWAPGLVLAETQVEGPWERWRATLEDVENRDRRSYAIGDLLPYGSLLVGISTGTADILVSDVELVRLYEGGRLRSLFDFRTAYEARSLPRARDMPDNYRQLVDEWIERLLSDDPVEVQEAVDVLVESGELGVEQLIPHVGSTLAVQPGSYVFRAGTPPREVKMQGEIIMGVLAAITGQAFTDARAWERWWGGN